MLQNVHQCHENNFKNFNFLNVEIKIYVRHAGSQDTRMHIHEKFEIQNCSCIVIFLQVTVQGLKNMFNLNPNFHMSIIDFEFQIWESIQNVPSKISHRFGGTAYIFHSHVSCFQQNRTHIMTSCTTSKN